MFRFGLVSWKFSKENPSITILILEKILPILQNLLHEWGFGLSDIFKDIFT